MLRGGAGERETFLAYNTPRGMRNIDRSVLLAQKVFMQSFF